MLLRESALCYSQYTYQVLTIKEHDKAKASPDPVGPENSVCGKVTLLPSLVLCDMIMMCVLLS